MIFNGNAVKKGFFRLCLSVAVAVMVGFALKNSAFSQSLETASSTSAETNHSKVITWYLGPVDPLTDMNLISNQMITLRAHGVEPWIVLMPVYDNMETETYRNYVKQLKAFQTLGTHFILREPVVNLAGTYGKDRVNALHIGMKNLLIDDLLVDGILLETDYPPDAELLARSKDMAVYQDEMIKTLTQSSEDILKLIDEEKTYGILIDPDFSKEQLVDWMDQLTDHQTIFRKWPDSVEREVYQKRLESWIVANGKETIGLDSFLDDEEAKIAGLNVEPEKETPGLDISDKIKWLLGLTILALAALTIMFGFNAVIRKRKHRR